jgi:hypothetical protein
MRQHHDSIAVEDEVAPELAPVLTAMKIGHVPTQQRPGVEENDIGVCVSPQERRTLESKRLVGLSLWIESDHEGQPQSILEPRDSLSGLEGDDDHGRVRLLESVLLLRHLHEMAFAQQSPDVAQEGQEHGPGPQRRKSQFLSVQRGEAEVGRSIARFH